MLFHSAMVLCVFITLLIVNVSATPANVTVVDAFLDCMRFYKATGYAYNVTTSGDLSLAALDTTSPDLAPDKSIYSRCNYLFGMGFHSNLNFGIRTYCPDCILLDLAEATGSSLVASGLRARDNVYSTRSINNAGVKKYNFVDIEPEKGMTLEEISSRLRIDVVKLRDYFVNAVCASYSSDVVLPFSEKNLINKQ